MDWCSYTCSPGGCYGTGQCGLKMKVEVYQTQDAETWNAAVILAAQDVVAARPKSESGSA